MDFSKAGVENYQKINKYKGDDYYGDDYNDHSDDANITKCVIVLLSTIIHIVAPILRLKLLKTKR